MPSILIIEDDLAFGTMLKSWLSKKGYETSLCSSGLQGRSQFKENKIDLVLCDMRLPDTDGILLLQWIKDFSPETIVIIMTSYADIETAVSAMKLGATDYLQKPMRPDELLAKIENALSMPDIQRKPLGIRAKNQEFIHGHDKLSVKLKEYMEVVAPTNMSVLIIGESGTGKEFVAKYIHNISKRSEKPFIAVDCGAISKELGVSELFGHKKGSFTSAIADKIGVFEAANGGTIFLDEIGNLSLEVQMQLLRALQERKIRPVGGVKEIDIDIRLIAATNENLHKAISEGRFREDLYHRVNEITLEVPALRDRGADIMLFANNFLNQANVELDKNIMGFNKDATDIFLNYEWSGNLRQMHNVVKRAVLFCRGKMITEDDLPDEMHDEINADILPIDSPLKIKNEQQIIEDALSRFKGNKSMAAKYLKIDRKTLYNKIKLYDIET